MTNTNEQVELHPAHWWTCPECSAENFVKPIPTEFSEEEFAELREKYGLDESERGNWCRMPEAVTCGKCSREYPTEDPMADERWRESL